MKTGKITVKVELGQEDVSILLMLPRHNFTDEMWNAMKQRECKRIGMLMGDQAMAIRLCFEGVTLEDKA